MQRNASAHWSGGLKEGKGTVSSASGVLKNTPYSFATRFESQPGTNPEELVAAAHAGCFTMALAFRGARFPRLLGQFESLGRTSIQWASAQERCSQF